MAHLTQENIDNFRNPKYHEGGTYAYSYLLSDAVSGS